MVLGRRTRRLFAILAGAALGLLVIALAIPFWLPWVLRPVARHMGVSYGRYERQGFTHFTVYDLSYAGKSFRLTAQRVEALIPTAWLWRLRDGTNGQARPFATVDGWRYETLPNTNTPAAPRGAGNYAGELQKLGRWLPVAALSNGTLQLPAILLKVPGLFYMRGVVTGTLQDTTDGPQAGFVARPAGPASYEVELKSSSLRLASQALISTPPSGVVLASTNFWWSNRFELQAQFMPGSSLPTMAHLSAPQFQLPPEVVGLSRYGDLAGSISANWQTNRFDLDLDAQAQPLPVETNFPPLTLKLHARGDTNSAIIDSADVISPWLTAHLSRELEVHFSGEMLRQPAFLTVAADLARQPWFPAQGELTGLAEFAPPWGKLPTVRFQLSGSQLGYRLLQTRALTLEGQLDWPRIVFSDVDATLDDGTALSAAGGLDLAKRIVESGRFRVAGRWLRRWLPAGYDFENIDVAGTVAGPFAALAHQGHLDATNVTSPFLRQLLLQVDWRGVGTRLDHTEALATAGSSSLRVEGGLSGSSTNIRVEVAGLTIRTNDEPVLTLTHPARVEFDRASPGGEWRSQTTPVVCAGKAGNLQAEISLCWPREGVFNVRLQQVSLASAAMFLKTNLPAITFAKLDLTGGWTNGPMQFALAVDAKVPSSTLKDMSVPLGFSLTAVGDCDGLIVSNLVVTSETSTVASVQGFLPVSFSPQPGTNLIQIRPDQPLKLHVETAPDAFFWKEVAETTGLLLREPQLSADLSGSWNAPVGKVNLRAREIQLRSATKVVPDLKNLELVLDLNREQARLVTGEVLVQGQKVTLVGELPIEKHGWMGLARRQPPDWTTARVRLQLQRAEISAFAPLFPGTFAPQGEISVDLALVPGGNLEGQLSVEHARTAALGDVGSIHDIGVNVRFHERAVELQGAVARISGATVTASGRADLSGTNWLWGELPPFEITLRGNSVPLVRQPEFVLRSDFLLGITKTNGAPPLVSGDATLRDSFYLTDLEALLPGEVATPSSRLPYFSIQEPFVANWRLAIDVHGPGFLKVRSPLFNGQVSAAFKLQGTLKNPIALGDLKVDSGLVRFPFASFQVQQGLVNLSSRDPYVAQLSVHAASKQFGYDIRMEIRGPVEEPVIQFNSTPPLTSEQILLMVTAGELPQGTFSLTPQQRAQTVAIFLGRDMLAKLGIGDPAEQRLTIRSGEEISDQGRPTYNVEYKFADRWSLTGEYDRFGDFNAGLKWRIYSK